ncbi:MAG: GT4 family glycosyltransferase PelF, partial [Euryarchaeota archaeon]|nr:GT4 family glycosyltransferase PelF [Euryarchaeota archaeon]
MRVLFLVSGVYPHYMGGVSTWSDSLIRGLPDVRFRIVSVVSNPNVELRYALPPNVEGVTTLPLWGEERPEEYNTETYGSFMSRRLRTRDAVVRRDFVPHFERFLEGCLNGGNGAESLAESLYQMHAYFQERDFRKTFQSRAVFEVFESFLQGHGLYQHIDLLEAANVLRTLSRYLKVLTIHTEKVDLSHSAIASIAGLVGVVEKMKRNTPFILTEHGLYYRERVLDLMNRAPNFPTKVLWANFFRALARLNYRFADGIYPVCSFNRRWQEEFGVTGEKISVIYNGVDAEKFKPMPVERPAVPTVSAVIRVDRLKDPMNLILAMDHVRKEVPEAQCLVYGPSPDLDYARLCASTVERLGLQDTVRFMGYTAQPEIAYNMGDVVAMPSISEGFPYALLEAMAIEKPIVATDVGGVREALGNGGILVPPRSPRLFADAIVTLLRDPPLRDLLGRLARDRALSLYSISTFLDQYRAVYGR